MTKKQEGQQNKNPVGKPLTYKTPEALQKAIDDYFIYCDGTAYIDDDGKPILNKYGEPVYINRRPPTLEGMCVHIGFNSKQTWYNYEDKAEYVDVTRHARMKLEQFNAESMYDRDRFKGAERTLVQHYGWTPANQINITNNTLNLDISQDEIVKRLAKAGFAQLETGKMEIIEND